MKSMPARWSARHLLYVWREAHPNTIRCVEQPSGFLPIDQAIVRGMAFPVILQGRKVRFHLLREVI